MSISYMLGAGVGVLCGIVVVILIKKKTKKDGSIKCKIVVYAVYSIWNDGYISLNENPKRVIIAFILIAILNFAVSIRHLLHGDLCENGVLSLNGINLLCGLLFLVVVAAMLAKQIGRRNEAD